MVGGRINLFNRIAIVRLTDFNDVNSSRVIIYLENCVHCTFILTFLCSCFLRIYFAHGPIIDSFDIFKENLFISHLFYYDIDAAAE